MKRSYMKITKLQIISIIILLFFASLVINISLSKYVVSDDVKYGDDDKIDFTINSVFVVSTADELFAAINQGYTYVQLDQKIENPLIITQKAENLNNDLILDLNGIEIQRNGYEPILNINDGVRLTIVDSSDEQTGGLYNPVGSVFNINGGTLTVVTGFFESGPRYSEYYTYNNYVLDNSVNSTTKRTLVKDEAQEVNFYQKGSETTISVPIIKSYPVVTGGVTYNHGNLYFDEDVQKGDFKIEADTYCYYRTSEDTLTETTNTSMADWYYTYYINATDYEYAGKDKMDDNDIEVTIYGYEDVISNASKKTNEAEYYAAIQMTNGNLEVQNGNFYQYFGLNKTACVNAQGGSITVNKGTFSSRVPDSNSYIKKSVNLKESDKEVSQTSYFNNFEWHNETSKSIAKGGESYCILNGGDATVNINNGELYSSNNNIISMQGGNLTIKNGTFTKRLTNGLKSASDKINLSGINMQSGKLTIENSQFNIIGDSTYAIYSTVNGNENFKVLNTDFSIVGDSATGIYSGNGKVKLVSNSSSNIVINGKESKGIWVENNGLIETENYTYQINGEKSYGIYSTSGNITMTGGNIYLPNDNNCYGIYSIPDSKTTISINNANIIIGCKEIGTGTIIINDKNYAFNSTTKSSNCYASVGVLLSTTQEDCIINLDNANIYCYELGVVSNGGTINLYNKGNIITNKASAIAIKGGNIVFDDNSDYTITSHNTTDNSSKNTYNLKLPFLAEGEYYNNTDGIYVESGSLTSKGNLNITHTGLQNETPSNYIYSTLVVTSYAIRVLGGDVTISKGTITASIGGGIYVGKTNDKKGNILLGDEKLKSENLSKDDTRDDIVKVYTLGNIAGESYNGIGENISNGWKSYKSITGGHAVELDGGNITIYNGIYEAEFGNGIFVNGTDVADEENGEITVYNGIFYGKMKAVNINGTTLSTDEKSGPAAFYGLKVIGGSVVKIYDGFFDGGNGGAFVTGVTLIESRQIMKSKTANVYIYKGTFGDSNPQLDGFNVYDDVNIVFGAYTESELKEICGGILNEETIKKLITINGKSNGASIALNTITNSSGSTKNSNVYIYYGTYTSRLYLDPNMNYDNLYTTYNTKCDSSIVYTSIDYTTIEGEQNNGTPIWYNTN